MAKDTKPFLKPSQDELDRRKIVGVNKETVTNVSSVDFPHHFYGEDNHWDKEEFRKSFKGT
jgi:DNA-directed RNA polymerase I and III subunit RPAC1